MAHEDTISHLGVSLLCACTQQAAAAAVITMAMIVVCRRYSQCHTPWGTLQATTALTCLLGASTKREAESKNYKTIYFY